MNFAMILQFLPYVMQLVQLVPQIQKAYNSSTGNTLQSIQNVLTGTQLVQTLEGVGAQLFPKLAPEFHAAAAALVIAHPDATSWLQAALNAIDNAGLVVDGQYGPKTRAAVETFQAKEGLHVTGVAADAENYAIEAALAALGG